MLLMVCACIRRSLGWLLPAIFLSCLGSGPVIAQDGDFLNIQRRITEIVEKQVAGVVRVKAAAEEADKSGETVVTQRVGTGFFISEEGHILTNASVALGASRIWVELDGVQYAADHLGSDPETNISLLKLMVLPETFSCFQVTANQNPPPIGSLVLAITCPLEFEPSPSLGMVTGHESNFSQRVFPVPYVRVNIPAHPGEGGSPVVDLNGRLVGIMVASLPEVGSSYLLPAKALLNVRDDLLFSGKVKYGWIGIELEERVDRQHGRHIVIQSVPAGTPASDAGIKDGDQLVQMGDIVIRRVDDVRNANFFQRIGDYVNVKVARAGEVLEFAVKMVERPASESPDSQVPPSPEGLFLGP